MNKNYLPQLRALEEFVNYAMRFSMEIEDADGNMVSKSPTGIRLAYLEKESVSQSFSADVIGKRRTNGPVACVLMTLFYQPDKSNPKGKQVRTPFAHTQELMVDSDDLFRALKARFPCFFAAMMQSYYESTSKDKKYFIEAPVEQVVLSETEFELPAFLPMPDEVAARVQHMTQALYQLPFVSSAVAELESLRKVWIVVDDTGHRVISHQEYYQLGMHFSIMEEKLEFEDHTSGLYRTWDEMIADLDNKRARIQDFLDSRKRTVLPSAVYPMLFTPSAAGTLFHEALGAHMLSGEYIAKEYSKLFEGKVDSSLMQEQFMASLSNIELWDAPLDEEMVANYRYDMEGAAAKNVLLIDQGTLKDYLHSRNSAAQLDMQPNGHAMAEWFIRPSLEGYMGVFPEPRVSNLKVISKNPVDLDQIKQGFFDRFGYYLEVESYAGAVNIEQGTFELTVDRLKKIYPDGSCEYYHGGVLSADITSFISAIEQVSDVYGRTQGYCGAASGHVPTEELAPYLSVYGIRWVPEPLPEEDIITDLARDKHLPKHSLPQLFEI